QVVDEAFISPGAIVVQERLDLIQSRRQTQQIEARPARQRHTVSFRREAQSPLCQFGEEEGVNGRTDLLCMVDARRSAASQGSKCPVWSIAFRHRGVEPR